MSRSILVLAGALAAAPACGQSCEEVELLVSSAGSAPGDVRAALVFGGSRNHAAPRAGGGVVCVTCTGLLLLDPGMRREGRLGPLDSPRLVAVGPGETLYTAVLAERAGASTGLTYDVVAFEPGGAVRWRSELAEGHIPLAIAAGPEGVYLELRVLDDEAEPAAVIALDGATGAIAWSRAQRLLDAADGGVFTVEMAPRAALLRHHAPAGAVVWERTLASGGGGAPDLRDAVATPDGGGIFVGRAVSSLDLGDRALVDPSGGSLGFVVELDRAGATRWAFDAEVALVEHVALTADRGVLLAGRLDHHEDDRGLDAFLALATPEGLARTHRLGGPADQLIEDLHASPDGAAWVQVSSTGGEGEPDPSLHVGPHRLDEPGSYLLGIVP